MPLLKPPEPQIAMRKVANQFFFEPGSNHSVPAFVSCDSAGNSLLGFVFYLENYQPLLRRLPTFEMVYAAPNGGKFHRAEAFFNRTSIPTPRVTTHPLCQYFTVRQLRESGQTSQLTRTDRELLRDGDQRYQGQIFDHAYRERRSKELSAAQVNTLVNSDSEQPKMTFKTHLLPESYDILDHVSINKSQRGSGTVRGNAHSTNGSAASSTSGTRKCLQAQEQTLNNICNTDAGKNLLWPGATPYFGAKYRAKIPSGFGGRSGHSAFASQANLQAIPRPYSSQSKPEQTEAVPRATQPQARRTYATTKGT